MPAVKTRDKKMLYDAVDWPVEIKAYKPSLWSAHVTSSMSIFHASMHHCQQLRSRPDYSVTRTDPRRNPDLQYLSADWERRACTTTVIRCPTCPDTHVPGGSGHGDRWNYVPCPSESPHSSLRWYAKVTKAAIELLYLNYAWYNANVANFSFFGYELLFLLLK